MRATAAAEAVDKAREKSASGLSELSRTMLKASYRKPILSAEAKAKARSEAFAALVRSLDPRDL